MNKQGKAETTGQAFTEATKHSFKIQVQAD